MPSAAAMPPKTETAPRGSVDAAHTPPSTSFRVLENEPDLPSHTHLSFGRHSAVPMREGDENLPGVDPARMGNGRYNAARAHHITLAKLRDPRSLYWRSLTQERRNRKRKPGEGAHRLVESADELWSAFEDYCEFVSENPMIVEKTARDGEVARLQAPPIVSKSDFASFCGFTAATMETWRDPSHGNYREDLADTVELIFETMRGAQVRQAAGREADPGFMKVLLGMAEKRETRTVSAADRPGTDALTKVFEQLTATSGAAPVAARAQVAFDDGTAASVQVETPVMPSAGLAPGKPSGSGSAGGEG